MKILHKVICWMESFVHGVSLCHINVFVLYICLFTVYIFIVYAHIIIQHNQTLLFLKISVHFVYWAVMNPPEKEEENCDVTTTCF